MGRRRFAVMPVVLAAALVGHVQGAETATEADELQEIVVTGSRLASGFDTPTPVAMFDEATLTAMAPGNIGEALSQLPSLADSVQNSTSGVGNTLFQTNGQNLLNLHQMGSNRTLILLDGQRMGVTNASNSVDINIIPQSLVKRVDVVTGGASASYGSDAVAGAINFILDTTFEGLKFDVNGGITDYGDVGNGRASITFGKALSDRSRVIGGVEFFKLSGFPYGEPVDRDWYDHPVGAWPNPVTGAQPTTLLTPDARSEFGSYGGTITAVQGCPAGATGNDCRALVNQKFLQGGALAPFNLGTVHAGGLAGGGDGIQLMEVLTPDIERRALLLRGEFDLNSGMTLWAQGAYNKNETLLESAPSLVAAGSQFSIQEDNAYLPAAVRSVLAATAGTQTFSLTRASRDLGVSTVAGNVEVKRYALGIKGRVSERWSYDTTLSFQDTHQGIYTNPALTRNLYAAADAVVNPANGQIVCRSTLAGLDPGCVPINLFGDGAISAAGADYINNLKTVDLFLKQTTVDANLRGDFGDGVSLGAGPVSFAVGVNYRRVKADREVDAFSNIYINGTGIRGFPTSLQGSYSGLAPLQGTISASEVYAEFGVPLLADLPFIQSLGATVAGRLTDYSQSGVENMWKLGLNWSLNDSVRFRGTLSADTRAPSVLELFNPGSPASPVSLLPYSAAPNAFRSSTGQILTVGNAQLGPEHARTVTTGLVFSPSFAPGLQTSVDYYKIDVHGVIGAPTNQNVVDSCYFGNQISCSYIRVNNLPITTTTGITATDYIYVTAPTTNQGTQTISGVEFEAAYKFDVGAGNLVLRTNGDYLLTWHNPQLNCPSGGAGAEPSPIGAVSVDCGHTPKIKARLSANYEIGPLGIYLQERYIHKSKINPNYVAGVNISFNDIPAIWYTDLKFNYRAGSWFGGESEVYANVTNLFDKDPPVTALRSRSASVEPVEVEMYDVLGRRYSLGLRVKF
jgi:iron complex outermembrane receptor protein